MSGLNTGAYPLLTDDASFAVLNAQLLVLLNDYVALLVLVQALYIAVADTNEEIVTQKAEAIAVLGNTDYANTGNRAQNIYAVPASIQTQVETMIWSTEGWESNLVDNTYPALLLGFFVELETLFPLLDLTLRITVDNVQVYIADYKFTGTNQLSVQGQVPIALTAGEIIRVLINVPYATLETVTLLQRTNCWVCNFFPISPVPTITSYPS